MADLPWIPLFGQDWLSSPVINSMTPQEELCYFRLLLFCWYDKTCSIPDDDEVLARLTRTNKYWKKYAPKVRAQFTVENGRLVNEVLKRRWDESYAKQERRRQAARAGNDAKKAKAKEEGPGNCGSPGAISPGDSQITRRGDISPPNILKDNDSGCAFGDRMPPSSKSELKSYPDSSLRSNPVPESLLRSTPDLKSEASLPRSVPVKPSTSKSRATSPRTTPLADDVWLKGLGDNPAYKHIRLDIEIGRMREWLRLPKNKRRTLTRQFVLSWLNLIDPPLPGDLLGAEVIEYHAIPFGKGTCRHSVWIDQGDGTKRTIQCQNATSKKQLRSELFDQICDVHLAERRAEREKRKGGGVK